VQLDRRAALDGVRAVSIIAVLLYHGGVAWAGGGFLGVEVFFVLSGFLITSLLVKEWSQSGRLRLSRFWSRRARRLLPALFALVIVIGIYYTRAGPLRAVPGLESGGIATLLYVGNWHQIAAGASYFAASGPVSPLQHTWSLAIEEQFYLLWPLAFVGALWLAGRIGRPGLERRHRSLLALLIVTIAAVVASTLDMAVLYRGGAGLDRVYYGTDSRATGLLIGATLAIALAWQRHRPRSGLPPHRLAKQRQRLLAFASVIALSGVLCAMHFATGESHWLFPWGLLAVDVATATLIASVIFNPSSTMTKLLSTPPLPAIGMISYGVYLWHFPIFLWLDQASTGFAGPTLLGLRIATTLVVAFLSYVVIEQPIRKRHLRRSLERVLLPAGAAATVVALVLAGAVGAQMPGRHLAPVPVRVVANFSASDSSCEVRLADTPLYRTAPLPPVQLDGYIFHWLLKHEVQWNAAGYPNAGSVRFSTCRPERDLVIGDSIAFTAGVPMLERENLYGVQLANAAVLGCAFGNTGQLDVGGTYKPPPPECPGVLERWRRAELAFHAQAVIVELGYRDEFDWQRGGRTVHLGQPAYDMYVRQQVQHFVNVLGQGGVRLLFMTVPYVQPPALPNGAPAPAGSSARHALINSILESVAQANPSKVRVLDIDKIVSPQNHYTATVNGQACRFDGIHFTPYCATLLQPYVLTAAHQLIDSSSGKAAVRQTHASTVELTATKTS
jgi:peptidoglycan/LPS O-acetylase OafA/YrhL